MIIVRSKKEIVRLLTILMCTVAVGAMLRLQPLISVFGRNDAGSKKIVVIDPGHGDPDGGAVGVNGSIEQKINLAVAKKVCEVLEGKGIGVIMTRTTDKCLSDEKEGKTLRKMKVEDMHKRLDIVKKSKADLFISIHMNCYESDKAQGLRIFYDRTHPETKALAEYMQEKMSKVTGAKTYAVKAAEQTLFLMKNPPVPSILAECGFISNPGEEKKLNDEDYQSRLAWAISDAAEKFCYGEFEKPTASSDKGE